MNSFKAIMVVLVCTPIVQLWAGPDTALHRAARANNAGQAVQRLLNTEQGRRCINYRGFFARTPLHYAAQLGNEAVVQMLLAANARVDVTDNAGRTPLHHAVREGHLKVISKLVSGGASEELADKDGKTPLDYVFALDDVLLARAFFGGMVVDSGHDGGNTLLHEAASAGALFAAAEAGEVAKVKELLKGGVAADSLVHGMTALIPAIAGDHEEMVRTLLAHGADANAGIIGLGETPLHCAAVWRRAHMIPPLLAYGADIGAINDRGTPLTLCSSDEIFVSRFKHFIQEHRHAVQIASALLTVFPVSDLVYGVLLPYVLEQEWPAAELQAAVQTRAKMASRQAGQRQAPGRQDSVEPAAKRRRT